MNTFQKHLAAITSGKITRSNIIGMRKGFNAWERVSRGYSTSRTNPGFTNPEADELTLAIDKHHPTATGELHDGGLTVLRNPRYAKRWTVEQQIAIDTLDHFTLIRFDWIGSRGEHVVPVYAVWAKIPPVAGVDPFPPGVTYQAFAFRNIPWQSAWSLGEEDGPCVVEQ